MGGVLDCSADPLEDMDFSNLTGPIVKPLHAMSIKELVYNVQYEKNADLERFAKSHDPGSKAATASVPQ
jgi:hypothetical protein